MCLQIECVSSGESKLPKSEAELLQWRNNVEAIHLYSQSYQDFHKILLYCEWFEGTKNGQESLIKYYPKSALAFAKAKCDLNLHIWRNSAGIPLVGYIHIIPAGLKLCDSVSGSDCGVTFVVRHLHNIHK